MPTIGNAVLSDGAKGPSTCGDWGGEVPGLRLGEPLEADFLCGAFRPSPGTVPQYKRYLDEMPRSKTSR